MIRTMQITSKNFTTCQFQKFLLDKILDRIFCCEIHYDSSREYMTAIGQLMNNIYLIQIRSDDIAFEDAQIVHISNELIDRLQDALYPEW